MYRSRHWEKRVYNTRTLPDLRTAAHSGVPRARLYGSLPPRLHPQASRGKSAKQSLDSFDHTIHVEPVNQANLVIRWIKWIRWIESSITSMKFCKGIFSHQSTSVKLVQRTSLLDLWRKNIALRVNCGASVLQAEQYFTWYSASLPHLSAHLDASMIQPRWLHWY